MEEIIKKILEGTDTDSIIVKQLINLLDKNTAVPATLISEIDSFSPIYKLECPCCGEILEFQKYSQVVNPFLYCYKCGKKLLKVEEKEEKV